MNHSVKKIMPGLGVLFNTSPKVLNDNWSWKGQISTKFHVEGKKIHKRVKRKFKDKV